MVRSGRSLVGVVLFVLALAETNRTALAALDVPCPSRAASGRIEAGQVQVIFHSPKSKRDIAIDYDGADWSESLSQSKLSKLTRQSAFNSSKPLVIYMHAYMQAASSNWLQEVRRHYDAEGYGGQFNLMLFDWSHFSRQRYDSSASWAPKLGQLLAKFLQQLQRASDDGSGLPSRTHLVSYSLSTHIAGMAGRYLREASGGEPIARITALDPTGVCFHQKNSQFASQYALRPSDAKLVLARHYDMGTLGASHAIGGLDVFVNGGKNQPTPSRGSARGSGLWPIARAVGFRESSHMMASLNEVQDQVDRCRNVAYACSSYRAFLGGECADCGRQNSKCIDLNTMDATEALPAQSRRYKAGTSMFIKTSQEAACIHHYQAVLRLKTEDLSRAQRRLLEDSLSFIFSGSGSRYQQAKVNHQPAAGGDANGGLYTALLTTENGQLAESDRIQMQLSGSSSSSSADTRNRRSRRETQAQPQQQRQMEELTDIIDFLELNYMSHDSARERAKRSGKFCTVSNASGILRKC